MVRLAGFALAGVLVPVLVAFGAFAQEAPSGTQLYSIHHSKYDDIGSHKVTFSRSGDDLMVQVENRIKVKVLFVTAYRFEAEREEIWREGRVVSYKSQSNDDGTDYTVSARAEGDKLMIEANGESMEAPGDVILTHPWNIAILEQTTVLDTKTGELHEVAVTEAGEETIEAGGQSVRARKFLMSGGVERELWFGPDDIWLQMRFDKDGAKITFTLQ